MFSRRQWIQLTAAGLAAGNLLPAALAAPPAAPAKPQPPPDSLLERCRAALTIATRRADGDELIRIGEWCKREKARSDVYGNGDFIAGFEKRVATLLGQEAACFFPTGTMAQLAALRSYADRSGIRAFAAHPSSHHILHEDDASLVLHGIRPVPIAPWGRPILGDDVRHLPEPVGLVSVELPVRWTGRLQTWDELEDVKRACAERKVALHVDGARLWECQPYYGKPLAEICRGFDSVYVSFYKGIGAMNGAILAGPSTFIEVAHLWRHRHGGNLFQFFPYVASAAMRLGPALDHMPRWVAKARTLAERIARKPDVIVGTMPPPTSLFHIYARGEPEDFMKRRDAVARDRGIWVVHGIGRARIPGFVDIELHLAEASDPLSDDEAAAAALAVLG